MRALQRKKEREETGLFACEGEDLCDAALAAGIEPVELLSRARTSRRSCSPASRRCRTRRARSASSAAPTCRSARATTCLALWQLARPGQRRHADPLGRRVRRRGRALRGVRRPALAEGAAGERRRDLPRPARRLGRASRPSGRARRERRRWRSRTSISTPPVTIVLGAERAGLARRAPRRVRRGRGDPDAGRRRVAQRRRGGRDRALRALAPLARSAAAVRRRDRRATVASRRPSGAMPVDRLPGAAAASAAASAATAREAAAAAARAGRRRSERRAEARGEIADPHRRRARAEVAAVRDPVDRRRLSRAPRASQDGPPASTRSAIPNAIP